MKRTFLYYCTLISALSAMTASIVGAPALAEEFVASQSKTVVETNKGSLVGALDDGIFSYLGVPYAHADRFMPAEEVAPWKGIRPAVTYGENCFIPRMKEVAGDELFNPHRYLPMSEACQFLNIWTPAINDGKKRPVMVWIHGGGFTNGSGIELTSYDGHNLSKDGDVVVVTLNHRLNVLGFLDLSAYGEKYKRTGNASVTDLVAALKWVHDNAAAFGGDPGNVTIFGQSGGGYKVRALMGTPSAKGLFQKAIVQSGSRSDSVVDQASSRKVAELTLANLGLKAEEIDKLADVDYYDLLAAADKAIKDATAQGAKDARYAPVQDGDYIPVNPVGTEWVDQAKDIPLMVGNTLNEFETVINHKAGELLADNKNNWDEDKSEAKLKERFADKSDAVGKAFMAAYPEKKIADAYFLDLRFRPGAIRDLDLKAKQNGAPVYSYMFAYESPVLDGIAMAWHCSELPYVFANAALVKTSTGGGSDALALSRKVSQAWVNFARNGKPSAEGLPDWPAYTTDKPATMVLDKQSRVSVDLDRKLLQAAGAL
ncbi:carboxylesterase/lipase family protein [Rhizobium leguminosarum]|uniref:Carboxylic ester hydrolase n=1 Tax=Rhizobium leguminosarum bv. trifolii (strain WSM1325) TaxID=395491 RepID=C6B6V0_RHILS|nr:carboxylesterase family protein [Rhizobium leguminosarum]ACS59808.1 Carboxylesterase type B [Rhizobium leguminosarum bv. trifolii WSM1325]MBY2918220.1 carboxylesterase/lipase family protein [Rhizobium leguminosarum]MBY2973571.1 carboxylesterase/lipase family protein [Rhizobium leguminosarum]MBY2980971.1 carboxylesterase/lipase family protein [Rhizobium leguminosarum]MBY3009521.1 carboxylesterase/lipase family protein [Rhizobium leguminosarum]